MSNTKIAVLVSVIHLLIWLFLTVVVGFGQLSDWFVLVFIFSTALAIYILRQRRHRDCIHDLDTLTDHIRLEHWYWRQLERDWIGRQVQLMEDIRNSNEPEGWQVYVQAGAVGEIVALNHDEQAPFQILFPGFAHKVAVRLEKIDLKPSGNLSEEHGVA